jgi:hypothetical protein
MNQSGLSAVSSTFVYAAVAFAVAVIGMRVVPAGVDLTAQQSSADCWGGRGAQRDGIVVFTYLLAHATRGRRPYRTGASRDGLGYALPIIGPCHFGLRHRHTRRTAPSTLWMR